MFSGCQLSLTLTVKHFQYESKLLLSSPECPKTVPKVVDIFCWHFVLAVLYVPSLWPTVAANLGPPLQPHAAEFWYVFCSFWENRSENVGTPGVWSRTAGFVTSARGRATAVPASQIAQQLRSP